MTAQSDSDGDLPLHPIASPGREVPLKGGWLPGSPGIPAFTMYHNRTSPIPVVIAVPHAGRAYPAALVAQMRNAAHAAPRLEDRYVDLIGRAVAERTGASLIVAEAPRAAIDLNRATDDIDWDMVEGGCLVEVPPARHGHSRRARSGLGLVPRRLPGFGELWKKRIAASELRDRIEAIHEPYHVALAAMLEQVRARWGAALLLDLHSMPPLPAQGSDLAPHYVVGDRFGASCDSGLATSALGWFTESGHRVAHNRPYAGGYVLERHARRGEGVHCLQLEIDRSAYLCGRLAEPGPGLTATADAVTGLVRRIAGQVAQLGREQLRWCAAAE